MRACLVAIVLLAGCDDLFSLDHVPDQAPVSIPSCSSTGEAIALPWAADTFIDLNAPSTAHGTEPLLRVDAARTALVRFNTGGNAYAAISLIIQAATTAPGCTSGGDTCELCPPGAAGTYQIDVISSTWTEAEATYASRSADAAWSTPGALGADVLAPACAQTMFNGTSMVCVASTDSTTGSVSFAIRSPQGSSALFGSAEGSKLCGASPAPAAVATCARPADERCGDGIVQPPAEACDDGNMVDDDSCTNTCASPGCGNGAIDAGEQCDDGNSNDLDECTNLCKTPVCGDGLPSSGETCDDANAIDTDGCINCMPATCGDGHVWDGVETCDDGNTDSTDACISCASARCGDKFVQAGVEQCDDGNQTRTDACPNFCTAARCGDGYVWAGHEQCDDGNSNNSDGCSTSCLISSR